MAPLQPLASDRYCHGEAVAEALRALRPPERDRSLRAPRALEGPQGEEEPNPTPRTRKACA
eukprot:13928820-Heterocapsa_arctica.AAC.1